MEKQRKWQFLLIVAVIFLTVYNILPTLFYYSKPLKEPVSPQEAVRIASAAAERLEELETETLDWIRSYCELLQAKPQSVSIDPQNSALALVTFSKIDDAKRLRAFLPRAGSLIPFAPAQLSLPPQDESERVVLIQRKIPIRLEPADFSYLPKNDNKILDDRMEEISYVLTMPSESATELENHFLKRGSLHPLFSELALDLPKDRLVLKFHPEAVAMRGKERFEQLAMDELARLARATSEELIPGIDEVSIPLNHLRETSGYLCLDQTKLGKRAAQQLLSSLKSEWKPRHPDLALLHVVDLKTYEGLSLDQQSLCLVVAAPIAEDDIHLPGMNPSSLYILAKGIDRIARSYEQFQNSELALSFDKDFRELMDFLSAKGFVGYRGSDVSSPLIGKGDILFEKRDFAASLLGATREEFITRGTGKMSMIELGNVEQRISTENKISTRVHEDLLKWKDEYRAAQISIDPKVRLDVPKPTKSMLLSNLRLSAAKYFRGDERKIIRWGLDLSGGKSIEVELIDANRQSVTNDADLKQGVNELYNRFNKMGVSEVSIRQVGHHIVLDFPASQAMSASELIKASTMYFHVVNEKFSLSNPTLAESVNRFLQEVWNEATVTGKKDLESINKMARRHLHTEEGEILSSAAQALWENGLRLAPVDDREASNTVDDSLSKIAILRGDDWQAHHQTNPLLIVFRNWAIEGAHLNNIHSGYDPGKGNFLSFDISSFFEAAGRKMQPQKDLFAWTSRYSKEKVLGTSLENYSRGRGWRMAVILNDSVISAPTLDSGLKESAMISGSFSQREVNKLAADLKVGSLTFTPQILSEKNVSPELGKGDRIKGITATLVALLLVIISMLAYYRFAGLVASIAVLFNLLILWATLQNLGATLSLAGLAAVVLTVGMAVDANVLVFERIKEEFAESGNIKSALSAGYQKAYSAIIDSNVTTIIAALILLNFDAGPIKSFAVNLIIGIASSMFTALFMTRFYFTGWARNPKHLSLKMANWIRATRFNFLKHTRLAFTVAAVVIAVGCSLIVTQKHSIFGLDFTGGYALNLELKEHAAGIENALISAGAAKSDFQVRQLDSSKHVRILFGKTLEQPSKPFYQMPLEAQGKNPRIEWAVQALQKGGLELSSESTSQLESNWTAISGQMSESMRNNALIGLALSFIAIFIYLSFRFEYQFAAAALLCLLHDVLITLGLVGLLHAFGVEIQIDLNTIAALMTIVGYSLNDTIIIFDRIREELKPNQTRGLIDVVNSALNATLSRTTMTSGTTLLVLIALVFLGGPSIFGFSLVMTIGVFFGTISSWFIAAPLMVFFQRREEGEAKTIPL
jgi:SecD/SecF fusion protein